MDDRIDGFVDNIFGGGNLMIINGVLGLVFIILGIILLARKRSEKAKKTVGFICIVIGIGIVLSGIVQSML
ncbi:putative membrane protein [Lachnospiraceae bacterium PF1-22]|uniref:hypothetical protein n=1 Tax=Ohessyouella blattaphilus TaxID=2949333 RepID=UPI003E2EAD81